MKLLYTLGLASSSALALLLAGCGGGSSSPKPGPQSFSLTVTIAGTGTGTITSSPAGINCPTTCSVSFPQNTQITLSQTPASNDTFTGWSGACTGSTTCSVTLSASNSVTATFAGPQSFSLTVTIAGTGTGTITSSPAGINCPTTCSASFPQNTQITLSETPASSNTFTGWSGACTGSTTCSVTLNASNSVTATFAGAGLQSINHIIIFAQENRSFDHYFGYMRQYWANNSIPDQAFDGLPQFTPASQCTGTSCAVPTLPGCDPTNPNGASVCTPDPAVLVPSFQAASICTEELSPFWNESHTDWNDNFLYPSTINWLGNGFVVAGANDARQYPLSSNNGQPVNDQNGYRTMEYFTDADLNYYYFMATKFATSDRWFAPLMSRTQMNRAYIYAGTSQGHVYPLAPNSPQLSAKPIVEALQEAGITWKIYVDTTNTSCANETGDQQSQCLLTGYSYLNQFTYEGAIIASAGKTPDLLQNIQPTSQFAIDAQNGTLPQVALIEPASTAGLDEHPSDSDQFPVNIQDGAAYAAGLINGLISSPSWKDSAMIFTYDEPGGFYDHVEPQPVPAPDSNAFPVDLQPNDACAGANQTTGICSLGMTGYRIPLIVISPFAKKNYVSHTVRDTTAWLNLVEERFSIPALTARDAYWSTAPAGPATMDEFFDFVNVPWATPPIPPTQNKGGTCSTAAPTP
jgi:phospholipase C